MSTIGGVFSETQLLDMMVRADALSFDDRIKQQFVPRIDVLKAIASVQNARINPLFGQKDRDVQVMWMNTCDFATQADVACDFEGESASTNTETYQLSNPRSLHWYVDEPDYDDNYFNIEEGLAKSMLKAEVELLNWFAGYSVAVLNTSQGVNEVSPEGKGDIVGATTYIAPSYWNPSLMAYFNRVAIMNAFGGPVMVSGNNLFESIFLANANAANADGKGDAILFNGMRWYFDLFNIDTVNTPAYYTYMINQGALAIAHKTINPASPEVVNGVFTRWTKPSVLMPGLSFDMFYKPECSGTNRVKHQFKMILNADIFLNPVGCTSTNTGVLSFICGTAPQT